MYTEWFVGKIWNRETVDLSCLLRREPSIHEHIFVASASHMIGLCLLRVGGACAFARRSQVLFRFSWQYVATTTK